MCSGVYSLSIGTPETLVNRRSLTSFAIRKPSTPLYACNPHDLWLHFTSMTEDRETWIRHFFYLALFAAGFHSLQFLVSFVLWRSTRSAALMAYGLDAVISAVAALVLAGRVEREWRNKFVAYGYMLAAAGAFYLGASMLWRGERPIPSVLGIAVAAASMLVIPIVGSY